MTREEFVDAIRLRVLNGATASMMANLEAPPGRRPPDALVSLSHWFQGLTDDDKARVELVARGAAHAATFSFLAVLDGVSALEPAGPKGELRLTYVSPEGEVVRLNSDDGEELHEPRSELRDANHHLPNRVDTPKRVSLPALLFAP